MTATHLLIHRYRPGTGPQEGTPEHDEEMRQWAELDARLRAGRVIVDAFAVQSRGRLIADGAVSAWDGDSEIVFAVHAIAAADDDAAAEVARTMPTASYGTVEVRPLMS